MSAQRTNRSDPSKQQALTFIEVLQNYQKISGIHHTEDKSVVVLQISIPQGEPTHETPNVLFLQFLKFHCNSTKQILQVLLSLSQTGCFAALKSCV